MKTLRRYVAKRFLLAFGGAFLTLGLLVIVIDLLLHVDEVLESGGGVADKLGLLLLRFATLFLPHLLPIATFIGAFLATGLAARSHELIAIKAAGISPLRALLPILVVAGLASAATLVLQETVSVPAAAALERREGDYRADLFRSADEIWYHTGRFIYNVSSADEAGDRLEGVRVFERDERGRRVRRIDAAAAQRVQGSLWRFQDARIRRFDPGRPETAPAFRQVGEVELALEEDESRPRLTGDLQGLPLWELARSEGRPEAERMRGILHARLSHPLLAVVLALLALPLGLGVERVRTLALPAAEGALLLFLLLTTREYVGSVLGAGAPAVAASWLSLGLFTAWAGLRLHWSPR